jgi:hypothetical protein
MALDKLVQEKYRSIDFAESGGDARIRVKGIVKLRSGFKPGGKLLAKKKVPNTRANSALRPQVAAKDAFLNAELQKVAYFADRNVLIFNMDVREAMAHLVKAGVLANCMVTSPPFYGQRDYGVFSFLGMVLAVEWTSLVGIFL